jgi:transposase
MSDAMQELARRLVVGHKIDGRAVYDEAVKAELVAACARPGASVSRLARECGVNANQLSRWVREHNERRQRAVAVSATRREAFVALPIEAATPTATNDSPTVSLLCMQARLPNGVVFDLRELDPRHAGVVVEALGRVRCSVSTKP